jgi:hypothetical protein
VTDEHADAHQQTPSPDLKALDRLIGSWSIAGGARGSSTYEWREGGFFLLQHVDLEQDGQRIEGIEIIGHDHDPSRELNAS